MNHFETPYQAVIYKTRYSRWLEKENRREEWPETVKRYVDFMFEKTGLNDMEVRNEVHQAILNLEVMPSMRALMTAGPALDRSNIAGYNCAFLAIDEPIAFDEALYVLMNGTGVGFSVESKYVEQLPVVPDTFEQPTHKHIVGDSKEGWAKSLRYVVSELYAGRLPEWSTYFVRPAGAPLKVFGGRASGPEPLNELLNFVVKTFVNAEGRQLTPLECHEIMCKVGQVVVVGGVRRAALISLSNLEDTEIRDAKSGQWWEEKSYLSLANNSVAYQYKPSKKKFNVEWEALKNSGSGERGIFNMNAARMKAAKNFRNVDLIAGTNPCGEIILRNKQFCNLSSVTIKNDDTHEDIKRKVRIASIIGTMQSALTDFPYLSDKWRKNCEEERLLGVSLNGVFNNPIMYELGTDLETRLVELRDFAVATNRVFASALGINPSKSVTCIKPEGTTSQMVGTSSGIHPWHSDAYARTIRGSKSDPVSEFLQFYGVHTEDDAMQPDQTYVFTFPQNAPDSAKTRDELTAIEHLKVWLTYSKFWADHNPSVTINVRNDEWEEVGQWVYDHFDKITGVSFLPYSDHTYQQAPYQELDIHNSDEDAVRFLELRAYTPKSLPWDTLSMFETHDTTSGEQQLSCVAGGCDLVSI